MDIFSAILALPGPVSGTLIVGATVVLALATYLAARAVLGPLAQGETRELAGSIIFRVSALHGLILALVFAEELVNLNKVERTVSHEAAIVADVFYDLKRYDPEGTLEARRELARYAEIVAEAEWERLATGAALSDEAWAKWVSTYETILDLEPATVRQTELKRIMLDHVRQVPELRRTRLEAAKDTANPYFMAAAIVGVMLTSMSFFTFPPNTLNLLLLSVFGAYTGLVIFFIVVFANPYQDPGAIEPTGFRTLFEAETLELGRQSLAVPLVPRS